jgi:hypothetical protein
MEKERKKKKEGERRGRAKMVTSEKKKFVRQMRIMFEQGVADGRERQTDRKTDTSNGLSHTLSSFPAQIFFRFGKFFSSQQFLHSFRPFVCDFLVLTRPSKSYFPLPPSACSVPYSPFARSEGSMLLLPNFEGSRVPVVG